MASELAAQLVNMTAGGRSEHDARVRKYDNAYRVWRGESNPQRPEPWQSKLRPKFGMQVIDTAMVNIVSGKPRCKVKPRYPEYEQAAKGMQCVLDYMVDKDHLVEKLPLFVQSGLIFGPAIAKNHWLYRTALRPTRREMIAPDGSRVLVQTGPEKIVERDGPTFEPWDVYDCWWDPDARDVDTAAYVVLRSYVSKDDLERLAVNEDRGTGIYHNVPELIAAGATASPQARAQQKQNDEKRKGKFELWEIWRETPQGLRLTILGNQSIVLRDSVTPYTHGKKSVVIAQTRPDLFEIAGIPETELVDHLQQALWTVQNMRMDQLHLTVMRGITYREGGVTDPNALRLQPRFRWPVQDHDDIHFVDPPPLPPEAYREEETLLGRMQLITGINPYVSGSDLQTVDQNTATGITALQDVASRLLRFKAQQIQQKGMQRTYEQWSDMIQQLLTDDVTIRIEGPGEQYTWSQYTPADIIGDYDISLEGAEESLSRQQERQEALGLLNAFAPLAEMIDIRPVLERVAEAYNFPNPQALLKPLPGPPPAAPGSPPGSPAGQTLTNGAPVMPGGMDPRIQQAIMQGGR